MTKVFYLLSIFIIFVVRDMIKIGKKIVKTIPKFTNINSSYFNGKAAAVS